MAGRGAPPKPDGERARRNKPTVSREVEAEPGKQPTLTQVFGAKNPMTAMVWHAATKRFWRELADFPTTRDLLPAQWTLLAHAVAIHDAALRGKAAASEARLQLAKFAVAPDDLLRAHVKITPSKPKDGEAALEQPAARKTAAPTPPGQHASGPPPRPRLPGPPRPPSPRRPPRPGTPQPG